MEEARDCRKDATKMHSVESGIESRRNGHTCRMTSGEKKEETSEKQRKTACGTRGHRTPNGEGGSGSRVQIPSGRNGRSYAGIGCRGIKEREMGTLH